MVLTREKVAPADLGSVPCGDVEPVLPIPAPTRDLRPRVHAVILAGNVGAHSRFREAGRLLPGHADSSSGTNSAASTLPGRVAVPPRRPPGARSIAGSATSWV